MRLFKILFLLSLLSGSAAAFSLDREAFSFTNYSFDARIEPEQHRLGVRGKITLRNDTATPQKLAVLQISSSLDWRAIRAGDAGLEFLSQSLTSDIDHTGALSEAIVTLPQAVAPGGTIQLDIAYEGVIVEDATRLTRIGTPGEAATTSDWDQIGPNFSAVRGAGYVAWYPVATESANLSEDGDLAAVLSRWKAREADSEMTVSFESTSSSPILFSGTKNNVIADYLGEKPARVAGFSMIRPYANVPTFVIADYKELETKNTCKVEFLPGKDATAASIAEILGTLEPFPPAPGPVGFQVAELPYAYAAPFVSQNLLLMPLRPVTPEERLTLVRALSRQKVQSPRRWIVEGVAHAAQALDVEQQQGRVAAVDYLKAHQGLLVQAEKEHAATGAGRADEEKKSAADNSLINTSDELYLQSKAMYVWLMLRDMIGEAAVKKAIEAYRPEQDKEPSYMPRLIAAQTQRDLEWFFDDWVYRDRGLPDFRVESAFSRKTLANSYIVAITVDNLGPAGAEVPVIVKSAKSNVAKRIEVRARSKAVIRIETAEQPEEIVLNDGSVPESDMTNNSHKIETPKE